MNKFTKTTLKFWNKTMHVLHQNQFRLRKHLEAWQGYLNIFAFLSIYATTKLTSFKCVRHTAIAPKTPDSHRDLKISIHSPFKHVLRMYRMKNKTNKCIILYNSFQFRTVNEIESKPKLYNWQQHSDFLSAIVWLAPWRTIEVVLCCLPVSQMIKY